MVSTLSIAFMIISLCICFGLPAALLIITCRRLGGRVWPALLGAAIFIFFAMILESSVANGLMTASPALAQAVSSSSVAYGLYAGLMAGIFEETGRLVAFIILLNFCRGEDNRLGNALSYGIGHGGIEAMLLVGMTYMSNLLFSLSLNAVGAESLLASVEGDAVVTAAYSQAIDVLLATPAHHFLAGGIERAIAILFHIAMSVLVWMAVSRRRALWMYPLAIGLHLLFNFPAALYQFSIIGNIWIIEGILLLIAAGCCRLVWSLYLGGLETKKKDG